MKITIMAGLLAEGDMNVDAGHYGILNFKL